MKRELMDTEDCSTGRSMGRYEGLTLAIANAPDREYTLWARQAGWSARMQEAFDKGIQYCAAR